MPNNTTRRQFLGQAAALTAGGWLARSAATAAPPGPNERLNIAAIGVTNRAAANLDRVASQNIVAVCDVDADLLEKGAARYPQARKFRDYREMLDRVQDQIDAVVVSTPDHNHAPAAAMALRLKKHVYCEKPLTHTVFEARQLAELAQQNKLVTQMGNQIHSELNYRRVVELIEQQAIGKVREVHVWAAAKYSGAKFVPSGPAPDHLAWDLWLGPAPERPYSQGVHPFAWRSFWDYGTGALGDFGCHYIDLAHWALKLRHPTKIRAEGPPVDPVSTPQWCIVHYEYPARQDLPAVQLTWYDSGRRPERLEQLVAQYGSAVDYKSGQLFVGDEGMLLSDYSRHRLLPTEKFSDLQPPEPYIAPSIGHHEEWLQAIREGGTTTCNFDYAGALTEAVLLGTVAYRSGQALEWDAAQLQVTNSPAAQQLIHKQYRPGWTL